MEIFAPCNLSVALHLGFDTGSVTCTDLLFQVTAKWLLDLEQFNEWMAEEDYMVDDEFDVSVKSPAPMAE